MCCWSREECSLFPLWVTTKRGLWVSTLISIAIGLKKFLRCFKLNQILKQSTNKNDTKQVANSFNRQTGLFGSIMEAEQVPRQHYTTLIAHEISKFTKCKWINWHVEGGTGKTWKFFIESSRLLCNIHMLNLNLESMCFSVLSLAALCTLG